MSDAVSDRLIVAADRLRTEVEGLGFRRIRYSYNPLRYAWELHLSYLRRFGEGKPGRVLLLGMNPGPWGMAQTGIPFGDPVKVRDWMGLSAQVEGFAGGHQRVPIRGLDSKRREVSGWRLYSWAEKRYGTARRFFSCFFIANYFPLLLLDQAGKNVTPARLFASERAQVSEICDRHLGACIGAIAPRAVAGFGRYAFEQARRVVSRLGPDLPVGCLLHPSPASPSANRNWEGPVEAGLAELGVTIAANS